jgi:Metallo-beta-lactamase superfamily
MRSVIAPPRPPLTRSLHRLPSRLRIRSPAAGFPGLTRNRRTPEPAPRVGSARDRAHLAAELRVESERWPVFVWTVDHPAGLVLVDTGMIDSARGRHLSPTPHRENIPRDVACVINTHLHFDHCGGNRLFPGVPIHVQARELADSVRVRESANLQAKPRLRTPQAFPPNPAGGQRWSWWHSMASRRARRGRRSASAPSPPACGGIGAVATRVRLHRARRRASLKRAGWRPGSIGAAAQLYRLLPAPPAQLAELVSAIASWSSRHCS